MRVDYLNTKHSCVGTAQTSPRNLFTQPGAYVTKYSEASQGKAFWASRFLIGMSKFHYNLIVLDDVLEII